jgi:hypothetical protein
MEIDHKTVDEFLKALYNLNNTLDAIRHNLHVIALICDPEEKYM